MAYDARRKHLAGLYTQGVITGEELVELQRQADLDEAAKLNKRVAELMGEDYLTEEKPAPAPKQPTEQPESGRPSLVGMTKEQFNSLSLREQSELYNIAPDYIEKLLNDRPTYMDLIEKQPEARNFKGTTLEDFKRMSLAELNELAGADRALYDKLQAESCK
jgi:hypothetical protein